MKATAPKTVLCIHDLSSVGRCSLSVAGNVLAAMGHQPVALPTALFSTHTGGLGTPARQDCTAHAAAALAHYQQLGLQFDCVYVGYLASKADADLANTAFDAWPNALKVVDPVLGDNGTVYTGMQDKLAAIKALCQRADVILPNVTEACLLLGCDYPSDEFTAQTATELADQLITLCPQSIITGIQIPNYILCACGGRQSFTVQRLTLPRSYPGTGDLFASVLTGALLRGNALSAAADAAAGFVYDAIANTDPEANPAFGVWYEPILGHLYERT